MPAYKYTCKKCQASEYRVAGISNHTVTCDYCGDEMIRVADRQTILESYRRQRAAAQ